ncbi:hypothetical protein CVIRNUC_001883 [Coccomyxa viridis]|uniref:Uncharacterized protein n=1 Tax=Coccomyxa viridis TaxID=1274662 RepID=A0AAV1HVB8_9CHLO|nr:hypothetical protein CVIRNUC_001883 [Coccomyxa viridis]
MMAVGRLSPHSTCAITQRAGQGVHSCLQWAPQVPLHSLSGRRTSRQYHRQWHCKKHVIRADNGQDNKPQNPDELKEQAREHVESMVEDMEEELDQDTTSALDGIVGSYEFNDKQLQVFQELVRNMRGAAWGLLAATAVTVMLSATKQILNGDFLPTDNLYFKGMTLARCFRVLDSVVLAILIYLGALAFKRVVASEKNQLAYCIQGIIQLGVVFMQMAPIAFSLAVVDLMVAAIRWPGVMLIAACFAAASSIVRTAGVSLLLSRYRLGSSGTAKALTLFREGWSALPIFAPIDRVAVMIVGASMIPYNPPKRQHAIRPDEESSLPVGLPEDKGGKQKAQEDNEENAGEAFEENKEEMKEGDEYEFTPWEGRILEVVMESMRMAGLALTVRAMATICLGIVEIRGLSAGGAWTYFTTDLVDQSVRAYLLFESAGCFQRVVRDEGQDITNLLEGLGSSSGISLLFSRTKQLTWGMTTFKSGELVVTLLAQTKAWAIASGWVRHVVLAAISFLKTHLPFLRPILASAGAIV